MTRSALSRAKARRSLVVAAVVTLAASCAVVAHADEPTDVYSKSATWVARSSDGGRTAGDALERIAPGARSRPVCRYGAMTQALLDGRFGNFSEGTGDEAGLTLEQALASENPLYRARICPGQETTIAYIDMPPPDRPNKPGALDLAALRLRAYSQVPIPPPRIAANPDGQDVQLLIDLPVWFAVDTGPGAFTAARGGANVDGVPVSMQVEVIPSRFEVKASTGQTVRCGAHGGKVWRKGASSAGACTMTFDTAREDVSFTVTTHWDTRWTLFARGQAVRSGTDGQVSSFTELQPVTVHERHVVNTVS